MPRRVPREYKPWEIEQIAQDFLREHWNPDKGFVDIEAIIECRLGILIDYTTLGSFDGTIARRLSDRQLIIVVGEWLADRNPNRYRYTLAQEVGHYLLHREFLEEVTDLDRAIYLHDRLTEREYHILERDANRCAAAILMPAEQFCNAARNSYCYWYQAIKEKIGKVIREEMQKRIVDDLGKIFKVSPQAARIRLQRYPVKLYSGIAESVARSSPFLPWATR